MSFHSDGFKYIVSQIEYIQSLLDDTNILISTGTASKDESSYFCFNLVFRLKNGSVKMKILYDDGIIQYTNHIGEVIKEVAFTNKSYASLDSSFNLAFKEILTTDKHNNPAKVKPNPSISGEKTELDRVRAELSGIN